MKESFAFIPVPAGDVSGTASALYELGGMVVIDDPSGCNSTYNTHDEIRWYDIPSYIFITGLNLRDATLGNDKKYIKDIVDAAEELDPAPRFIALCNSPVPFLTGRDYHGLARIIEKQTGIPTFYVQTNGMHDYTASAGEAWKQLLVAMLSQENHLKNSDCGRDVIQPEPVKNINRNGNSSRRIRLNILGMTPLDYGNPSSLITLKRKIKNAGFDIQTVFAMGDDLDQILTCTQADVSLVVSVTGLKTAEYLKTEYSIPYVVGTPVMGFEDILFQELRIAAAGEKYDNCPYAAQTESNMSAAKIDISDISAQQDIYIYSEPVISGSIAYVYKKAGYNVTVINPLESGNELLPSGGIAISAEADLADYLKERTGAVVTDPFYKPVIPDSMRLIPFPTLAVSGRQLQAQWPDIFAADWARYIKL